MDLTQHDWTSLSRERKIAPLHLARELVQLEFLRRIAESSLKRLFCFKGGTALHLVFNMERYSEDLDFSLVEPHPPRSILAAVKDLLSDEEITDAAIKRKTVLVEVRQPFHPHNFRVKFEINTNDIAPGELKTLYSDYTPASFLLQVMRTDHLVAQKIRALMQRDKARDLYDLWFILRTKLPVVVPLVAKLLDVPVNAVLDVIEERVAKYSDKQTATDLNPYVKSPLRGWLQKDLKNDTRQLLRSLAART